jgi:hypothetical protein
VVPNDHGRRSANRASTSPGGSNAGHAGLSAPTGSAPARRSASSGRI